MIFIQVFQRGLHLFFPAAQQRDDAAERIILQHLDVRQNNIDIHAKVAGNSRNDMLTDAFAVERQPNELLMGIRLDQWVPPFGYPRLKGYLLLPVAFRSLSRPSSALSA